MSNYYDYRDVKVAIAERLMSMDGWKVYGYYEDNSDPMTDYYDPASWGGVAEKNGYILCVNVYGAEKPQEIRKYDHAAFTFDKAVQEKIEKLERMTVERGASEAEAESARRMIERLQRKAETAEENSKKYIVTGIIPGHMANPPRCNWHIEKDGIIIDKGTGLLKFRDITNYLKYSQYKKSMEEYREDPKKYEENYKREVLEKGYYDTEEKAAASAARHAEDMKTDSKLLEKFDQLINKFDTTCGGMLGEGDGTVYEKVKVTKYKKEIKAQEASNGKIKEGQCFILKTNFNYGRRKGLVYRIHESEYNGKTYYSAFKLNGKLNKECTGFADASNRFSAIDSERFKEWIEKGYIAWCTLVEVNTPYVVEKVVKRSVNAKKAESCNQKNKESRDQKKEDSQKADKEPKENKTENHDFEITPSQHTKTHENIWLVKVKKSLSKDEFQALRRKFATLNGYYSTFTHSFIFKYDPTEKIAV